MAKKKHPVKKHPVKKPSPEKPPVRKPEQKIEPEAETASGGLIKMLIIGGTFAAILLLSIITKGADDGWPSAGVVGARIVLLSACAAIYFGMLYHTRASRRNEKPNPQAAKK
jgi:hypothetical protein